MLQRSIILFFIFTVFSAISVAQDNSPILTATQKKIIYEVHIFHIANRDLKSLNMDWATPTGSHIGGDAFLENNYLTLGSVGRAVCDSDALLSALTSLTEKGKARLLTSPKLLALEGVEVSTASENEFSYITSLRQTPKGVDIQTKTGRIGTNLTLKSLTSANDILTLSVDQKTSTINGYMLHEQIALPNIVVRSRNTTLRLKSGETFAIAGITGEENAAPKVIGGGSRRRPEKSQILIFITAKTQKNEKN
jgi:type II secretory pathway component GspD/PulD (secretin)